MTPTLTLGAIDISLIILYFVAIFALALIVTERGKFTSSSEYFLAGKNLGWFLVGSSIFASNIGSEHLIGLAGSGASSGVAVSQFENLACFILILLGWFFIPFYIRTGVSTMPEFLEKRYSPAARNYLTFVSIVAYVLTKISVTIYAGAVVFEAIGIPFWQGAGIVVIATGIYTVIGGLRAVIYTDALQMLVMIGGAILITILGLGKLGGFAELTATLPEDYMSLWRPMTDESFPWTGILFGAPILGVWYWCTDQFVVQRTLSARNLTEARRGTIFAGFLKLLPLFIFVLPGMICYALSVRGDLELPRSDQALPTLATFVLPVGLRGLFVAGLLSALMSSLSSVFNSCSTLITYEVFKRWKPEASEKTLISVGRWSTAVLVVFGILWIPMMKLISGGLFEYLQSVQAYISPPIAAVFLVGLLYKKINSNGALTALYSGFVIGIGRLVCEINKPNLDPNGFLYQLADINFLHFALILFIISTGLMLIVSLATQQPANEEVFETNNAMRADSAPAQSIDKWLSVALVACVLIIWWVFS